MVTIKKTLADALTGYLLGPEFKRFFFYFSYKYVFSNSDLTMVQKVLLL